MGTGHPNLRSLDIVRIIPYRNRDDYTGLMARVAMKTGMIRLIASFRSDG
jgi:hypothetical protein